MKTCIMEKILILVRGLPGCGKSTFAELLADRKYICTADDYFMKEGKYIWNKLDIGTAHRVCQIKCKELMQIKTPRIVVANTSTTKKELKSYYDLAIAYGYKVFSVIVENRLNTVNVHNVPEETIINMKKRFDISL